jgi:hypothetical protein
MAKKPKNRNTSGGVGQFDVILTDISTRKISVITVIRGATGRGLKDGKDLVESAPGPVMQGIDQADAEKLAQELEAACASVDIAAASRPAPKPSKKAHKGAVNLKRTNLQCLGKRRVHAAS